MKQDVFRYETLKKTLKEIIQQTKQTNQFDFGNFFNKMEHAFRQNGFREEQKSGVENILVIRLDALGDFVLTTAFIRELRLNNPNANITLVVSKFVYPIAELCPYVNRVEAFDGKFTNNDIVPALEKMSAFVAEKLWSSHYNRCFSVQYGSDNLPALFMTYLSGARERIGYGFQIELLYFDKLPPRERDISYALLTRPIINPKELVHEAEKCMYLLKAIGLPIRSKDMELWYSFEDIQNAGQLLREIVPNTMKVVVGIGAGGGSRKYPVEQYITAFKAIAAAVGNKIKFIIIGGRSESQDAAKIQSSLPKNCVLNLVEKTSLRETIAVIEQSDIFIGNDTGVMHMAAALHVPIIAVYRQPKYKDHFVPGVFNEYYRFAPYKTTAIVLRPEHALDGCKDAMVYGGCKEPQPHCITQVKPEEIVKAFEILSYLANSK